MEECPKCLGNKEIMVPKRKKGFNYVVCNVCEGKGIVHSDIAEDYINSNLLFENEE